LDLVLNLNYFSFSNPNINPNPTHLPKHPTISPNHQFSQRISYAEHYSVHVHMTWSQKFRKSEISLDTGTNISRAKSEGISTRFQVIVKLIHWQKSTNLNNLLCFVVNFCIARKCQGTHA